MKKLKQFPAEFQRQERLKRSRGHVTEQGGGSEGKETRLRNGEDLISETEGQVSWRAEKRWKL